MMFFGVFQLLNVDQPVVIRAKRQMMMIPCNCMQNEQQQSACSSCGGGGSTINGQQQQQDQVYSNVIYALLITGYM